MSIDITKPIRIEAYNLCGDPILDISRKFSFISDVDEWIERSLNTCGNCHVFLYQSGAKIKDFIKHY